MNTRERIKILQDTINTHRQVLKKFESRYKEFLLSMPLDNSDKGFYIGIVLADFFERYYTCVETIFLRISQYFENQLEPNRWHRNLLERMTVRFEGIRERVLSEKSYYLALEFLKFRHFKRYYFDVDYDWDKLIFLQKKFDQLTESIHQDLDRFDKFLTKLTDSIA